MIKMLYGLLIFCAALLPLFVNGYKILIYNPQLGHSHVNFMGTIADILVEAGHDVTVYIVPMNSAQKDVIGTKKAKVVRLEQEATYDLDEANNDVLWGQDSLKDLSQMLQFFMDAMLLTCDRQLNNSRMMKRLKDEHFDLAIGEAFDLCALAVFHAAGIDKKIITSSTSLFERVSEALGIPSPPSYIPGYFSDFAPDMDIFQRAENAFEILFSSMVMERGITLPLEQIMKKRIGPSCPGLDILIMSSSFVLVNNDEYLDFPRPISSKIVYVGGISVKKAELLDKEYESIFSSAKQGVILVSFGSNALSSRMPKRLKTAFLETFKAFPNITFIWKYEVDDLELVSRYPNVVLKKWVPQVQILNDSRLLAFVTHAGMGSVLESVYYGVPLIMVPLFGDQKRNARMVERKGTGIIIKKQDLNAQKLTSAIELITQNSVREKARELSRMIKSKPLSSRERMIKYVEFAAEFDVSAHITSPAPRLNFLQYFLIDAVLLMLIFLAVFFTLLVYLIRRALYLLAHPKRIKDE